MSQIMDELEEYFIDLLARIDDGEEKALEELKKIKKGVESLHDILQLVDEKDTLESIEKKFEALEEKLDEVMMAMHKVVG